MARAVSRPGVPALVARRFCSPMANTPWHQGEKAVLADLFLGDPAGFGQARSMIDTMANLTKIVCPLLGGYLAAISISVPWAVSAVRLARPLVCRYHLSITT